MSTPTSRWLTNDFLLVCTYSTGSSTVMMCPPDVLLRWSISAASVVDLPDPVPPTTSTSPRLFMMTSFSTGGRDSFSKLGISDAMVRITMPTCCC